jgi:hypothetical protein
MLTYVSGGKDGRVRLWSDLCVCSRMLTCPDVCGRMLTYADVCFVSGGKDGRVRLWSGLDPVKIFDFSGTCVASTIATRIRSACWRDGHVLVGTMSNEIFEVTYAAN